MQSISNVFKEYLRQRNREWLVKVDIAGEEYGSETIVDFTVETSVSTGEELEIGTANISKLTLRLKKTITVPPNARVVPYVALSLPEEYEGNAGVAWQDNEDTWETADYLWNGAVTEWLPMGEFFVDTRQIVQGHILELTCVDRMRFADIAYVSSLTYPTTMQAVWDEVCDRAGFAYGDSVQINPSYQIEVGPVRPCRFCVWRQRTDQSELSDRGRPSGIYMPSGTRLYRRCTRSLCVCGSLGNNPVAEILGLRYAG